MGRSVRVGMRSRAYREFREIDGRHPFREAVPRGFVAYPARRLRGADVAYFNFGLAREMGLIAEDHPSRMNRDLRRAILDTFALVIINEYDQRSGARFPLSEMLSGTYIATRYLQLQHPDRRGTTSGDGRAIWNGIFSRKGITWDVTSCGTGVTSLCPATAEQKRFFKTGSRLASYGCGTCSLEEGLTAALMSETFHRNGLKTERVLAVLTTGNGFAIKVRAGRNLLRPSHFFLYSRQNDLASLRGAVDYFLDRQVGNGDFEPRSSRARAYRELAREMARTFGRMAATFEREYVFCWLDWDGDNILADGGIIDYGSVRQFGLFHREYRFDDGPRMSTTITEQRRKARYIVQQFAQIRDYLIRGVKPALRSLSRDPVLQLFDTEFETTRRALLLRNVGLEPRACAELMRHQSPAMGRFDRVHAYFERARSARGPRRVPDGITWNAIFSTRDLLRELPARVLEHGGPLEAREILRIARSSYATRADRTARPNRLRMAAEFQDRYLELLGEAARRTGRSLPLVLASVSARSAVINRFDRITGDAVVHAARTLGLRRRRLGIENFHRIIDHFVERQTLVPGPGRKTVPAPGEHPDVRRVLEDLIDLMAAQRHGL